MIISDDHVSDTEYDIKMAEAESEVQEDYVEADC